MILSLTSSALELVLLKPVVQLDSLGWLDGYTSSEVLREVTLVYPCLLYHLTLRDGVLVKVLPDCLGHQGLVSP